MNKNTMLADKSKIFFRFDKAGKAAFLSALISYLFVYGFELTHFTLSIDEENMNNFYATLSTGRWGHSLLRMSILPEPYVPFFTMFFALVVLSLSSSVMCRYLKLDTEHSIVFSILIAAIPQMAYQLEFNNQADTVALAILCSSVSLTFIETFSIKNSLTFIVLTVISLSIYQSIFLYAASLLCVRMAFDAYNNFSSVKSCTKKISCFFTLVVLSLLINFLLDKLIMWYFSIESSSYLSQMIGWDKGSFREVIHRTNSFVRSYLKFKAPYGLNMFSFTTIAVVIIAITAILKKRNFILVIILSILCLASGFILNYALGTHLVPRAMTQLPVIFAGLLTLAIFSLNIRFSGYVISLIFLISGASYANRLFYSDYMARKGDKSTASEILSTIYNKYPEFDAAQTPVFFYGGFQPLNTWKIPTADVFGASFFSWDGGNNSRIYNFFKVSNIAEFQRPSTFQIDNSIIYAKHMQVWPNHASIELHDGVVIVKLGKNLSQNNK